MKRIGIDAHMLGDHSGGNETYYKNILENMVVPNNIEVYIFVTRKADISGLKDKYKIVYFSNYGSVYRNVIELPLLCRKYKLDLLHVQYFIPFFRPCKVMVTIHDICFEHYKDIFTKKEYIRQKLLIPYAAKKSALIITDSEYSKKDISSKYNISCQKIIPTYCAANNIFRTLMENEIDIENLKRKFGIKKNYILTVGNLQPRKNILRLLKAFKLLRYEYTDDIQLVIVGKKAWMYDEIFSSVDLLGEDIVFTGYVDESDLVRLYNCAKCFTYPSLFEGFGLPVVEAMACGTPVVISNSSSLPEVAGKEGIYFEPTDIESIKDGLLQCLCGGEEIINMKEQAKLRAKMFNWKRSADVLIEAYCKLL